MAARQTLSTSIASAHTEAETGGITSLPGAPAVPNNLGSWSRTAAKTALSLGQITQAQFVSVMNLIAGWEEAQRDAAVDTLRATNDVQPVWMEARCRPINNSPG